MRGHFWFAICALALAACSLHLDSSIPEETYRNSEDGTALIVDGEQAVWLAAAKYVRANAGEFEDHPEFPLQILARTSFPTSPIALAQLENLSTQGFCDLSPKDAKQVFEALRGANYRQRSLRDVFEHRSEFRLVESRPEKGDHLGISGVVFDREAITAYLDLDIGGPSGSIVRMTRVGEEWGAFTECATWTTY